MEALNIRLDRPPIPGSANAIQGKKSNNQDEFSFSAILDRVMHDTTEGKNKIENESRSPQQVQPQTDQTPANGTGDKAVQSDLPIHENLVSDAESDVQLKEALVDNLLVQETFEPVVPDAAVAVSKIQADDNAEQILLENLMAQTKPEMTAKAVSDFETEPQLVVDIKDAEDSLSVFEKFVSHSAKNMQDAQNEIEDLPQQPLKKNKLKEGDSKQAELALASTANNPALQMLEQPVVAENDLAVQLKTEKNKQQEKAQFTIIDERSIDTAKIETGKTGKDSQNLISTVKMQQDGSAEITMSLPSGQQNSADGTVLQNGIKGETRFSTMLSEQLQNNANDLVKTGTFVLRDNNSGTINLILRPEQLGNVKIHLELSDKVITGKIIVASEEAYAAFKNNIEGLRQSFVANGFENAGFELSWSGQKDSPKQDSRGEKNPRGLFYSENVPLAATGTDDAYGASYGLSSINVMA